MITVSDLCMHYGPVVALHKATFNVERGEVVGLLGPNGAGKSTTMKLLTTYLYPTFGNATVGGKSIRNEAYEVRQLIGYLPEVLPLYPEMEVRAYLDFVGRARGFDNRQPLRITHDLNVYIESCSHWRDPSVPPSLCPGQRWHDTTTKTSAAASTMLPETSSTHRRRDKYAA